MNNNIKIFESPDELAMNLAQELVNTIIGLAEKKKNVTIALSGGSTPERLLSLLGQHFSDSVPWEFVHFFWGDERCVGPDNIQSNFGMADRSLFRKIKIPSSNIHRIHGEADPEKEALRYSHEISESVRERDGLPLFDIVLLGLGEDGHTASIFPGKLDLFDSENICDKATHPVSGQYRITITGKVINNADKVWFLVSGRSKASVVGNILSKAPGSAYYPASCINPVHGSLHWYLDKDAASKL